MDVFRRTAVGYCQFVCDVEDDLVRFGCQDFFDVNPFAVGRWLSPFTVDSKANEIVVNVNERHLRL